MYAVWTSTCIKATQRHNCLFFRMTNVRGFVQSNFTPHKVILVQVCLHFQFVMIICIRSNTIQVSFRSKFSEVCPPTQVLPEKCVYAILCLQLNCEYTSEQQHLYLPEYRYNYSHLCLQFILAGAKICQILWLQILWPLIGMPDLSLTRTTPYLLIHRITSQKKCRIRKMAVIMYYHLSIMTLCIKRSLPSQLILSLLNSNPGLH